jgi:geranylgeranyl diphosphate synthase type I
MFKEYLQAKKSLIDGYLIQFLDGEKENFKKINFWGEDLIEKLKKFVVAGKTIRGTLVFLSSEMFDFYDEKTILPAAAAMELIQSSLLIHDDIMDRDLKRRGIKSVFATYLPIAQKEKFPDPFHFAASMGICAGDIGFFLAFKLINSLPLKEKIADVIIQVGLGQMADAYWGYKKETPKLADIEKIYLYKTARYSFSLPLALGAIISHQPKKTILLLEKLGESLGVAFQIKDDMKDKNVKNKDIFKKLDKLIGHSKQLIARLPVKQKYRELLLGLISKYLLS